MRTFALAALLSVPVALAMQACSSDDENPPAAPQPDAGPDVAIDAPAMRTTGRPQTCERGTRVTEVPTTCNGSAALCSRTYDRVAVPMTHNAYSLVSGNFGPPNQTKGIGEQLDAGIRGMMLDTAYFDPLEKTDSAQRIADLSLPDQTFLCHGFCTVAQTRLLDELCTITKFLDGHPGEVFSIIFENRIADADTAAMLQASGLADYVYTHKSTTAPWPTLGDMIASGKRAVIFLEKNGGTPAYLHPAWTNVWDTPYAFASAADFSCRLNRGATTNPLFLVNHWLSPPKPENGDQVNVTNVLGKRVEQCTQETGRVPTFIGVDWYDKGNLFDVVKQANGL